MNMYNTLHADHLLPVRNNTQIDINTKISKNHENFVKDQNDHLKKDDRSNINDYNNNNIINLLLFIKIFDRPIID